MKLRNIFLLALSFSFIGCGFGNQDISTIVKIENGSIKGVQEGNLKKYLGIPYAEPPVGNLRWAPARPALNWDCLLYTSPSPRDCT